MNGENPSEQEQKQQLLMLRAAAMAYARMAWLGLKAAEEIAADSSVRLSYR
jgi:hypothetical protein